MNRRMEPGPEVWVDERLKVSESPIEGSGLFFTEDVPPGTVIIRLGGRLVSSAELDRLIREAVALPTSMYVDTITVYENAHLVLPTATPVHFCNHSCNPNLWLVGPYELATRRPATAGDEATTDYATFSGAEGFEMDCRCGVNGQVDVLAGGQRMSSLVANGCPRWWPTKVLALMPPCGWCGG